MKQVWQSCDGLTFETEEACREYEEEYYAQNKEKVIGIYNALKAIDKWCRISDCEGCSISEMCDKHPDFSNWTDFMDKTAREIVERQVG